MCGIAITTKDKLRKVILNQQDRGLDSVGVITKVDTARRVAQNYRGYKKFLKRGIRGKGLAILHHRKASIGAININNAHPFQGKYFKLMQNGTSQSFFNTHKFLYNKQTDSETLLYYIEDRTQNIKDIPDVLEQLSNRIKEDFGIIIVVDNKNENILFYSDGARESYLDLDLKNNKVNGIYNYKPDTMSGYDNRGYIILDFDFNIICNTFTNINSIAFYDYYSGTYGYDNFTQKKYHTDYYNGPNKYYNDYTYDYNDDYKINTNNPDVQLQLKNLTVAEKEEYNEMYNFLVDGWSNLYSNTLEQGLKDYLLYYYGVDTINAYKCYYSVGTLDLLKIFKIAYKQVFGF